MSERAKYWQRMLAAWKKSGLTQAEFCRRRGLKAVTFAWWKRQLVGTTNRGSRGRGPRRNPSKGPGKPSFVEVALPREVAAGGGRSSMAPATHGVGYEVALPDGTWIRLPVDFDVDRASHLISAVARSC